jgi:hypothetical protein
MRDKISCCLLKSSKGLGFRWHKYRGARCAWITISENSNTATIGAASSSAIPADPAVRVRCHMVPEILANDVFDRMCGRANILARSSS